MLSTLTIKLFLKKDSCSYNDCVSASSRNALPHAVSEQHFTKHTPIPHNSIKISTTLCSHSQKIRNAYLIVFIISKYTYIQEVWIDVLHLSLWYIFVQLEHFLNLENQTVNQWVCLGSTNQMTKFITAQNSCHDQSLSALSFILHFSYLAFWQACLF